MTMNKLLLSTTALVAASFLTAGVANAELSISAAQTYLVKYTDGSKDDKGNPDASIDKPTHLDDDANKIGQTLTLEQLGGMSEIVINGSGTTDAGLNYGINIQMRPQTSGVGTDEATVFIGGDSWGKISLGEDDDALDGTAVGGNSVLVGIGAEWNDTGHSPDGNDDYARIMYSTPSFSGFNAAVSFTPQAEENDTAYDSENMIAAGANFSQDFGNMGVKVGGGVRIQSYTNRTGEAVGDLNIAVDEETATRTGFKIGAVGTFDAFSVGVGFGSDTYTDKTVTGDLETTDTLLNAGVAYNFGQGGVSVGYFSLAREIKDANPAVESSSSSIIIDADYKLADGLTALLEVVLDSSDPDTDNPAPSGDTDPSTTEVAFGLRAAF